MVEHQQAGRADGASRCGQGKRQPSRMCFFRGNNCANNENQPNHLAI
jgi:hypothetical protein